MIFPFEIVNFTKNVVFFKWPNLKKKMFLVNRLQIWDIHKHKKLKNCKTSIIYLVKTLEWHHLIPNFDVNNESKQQLIGNQSNHH